MSTTPEPVAVIGATGKQGGAVVTACLTGARPSAPLCATPPMRATSLPAALRWLWAT